METSSIDAQIPFDLGIEWSAPLATNVAGSPLVNYAATLYGLSISEINSGVVLMTETNTAFNSAFFQEGWIVEAGYSAINGAQLWITNRTETPYSIVHPYWTSANNLPSNCAAGNGVFIEVTLSTMSMSGYNLFTGDPVWGPITLPNASPYASLGMNDVVANGTMYLWTYGGDVYAVNMANGAVIWQYHTPSGGYESPYGTESLWTFNVGTVAGGMLFVPEGHMYSPPLFHGAQQLALNITNGQLVWSLDAFDVTSAPAISDGIMTTLNAYDNQIYAYGKGQTATTVTTAPGINDPAQVLIKGTVTDQSPGQTCLGIPAAGTPAISDASMSQWMEYLYMQQPEPTNATGVPVTLTDIDPNGNSYTIGTTTSDITGQYSYTFTPNIPGTYKIIATFGGSNSYYSSIAETSVLFNLPTTPAPTAAPVTGLATASDLTYGIVAVIIAMIIAIAIVGLLLMRKKP